MDCGLPPPSERLLHREARVVEPSLVEKFGRAVWPTRPCQRGNLVDHRPKIVNASVIPSARRHCVTLPASAPPWVGSTADAEGVRGGFNQNTPALPTAGRSVMLGASLAV